MKIINEYIRLIREPIGLNILNRRLVEVKVFDYLDGNITRWIC